MTTVSYGAGTHYWTCPTGLTRLNVSLKGGGGGGHDGYPYESGGGGGGGSEGDTNSAMISVTPGQTYTIVVGGGGAANSAGGWSSAFGVSAAGGAAGNAYGAPRDGTAGAGTGGGAAGIYPEGNGGNATGTGCGGGGGSRGSQGPPSYQAGSGGLGSAGAVTITYFLSTPTIGKTPASGNAPLDVTFTGSVAEGSVSAWAWNFGDGGTSGTQNPTHQYTIVGQKTVTLTVTTSYGSWSTTATVTVYWRPSAHAFVISTEPWRR